MSRRNEISLPERLAAKLNQAAEETGIRHKDILNYAATKTGLSPAREREVLSYIGGPSGRDEIARAITVG